MLKKKLARSSRTGAVTTTKTGRAIPKNRGAERVSRFSGTDLHARVLEAAEAEVEARYATVWAGSRAPLSRPAHGWRRYARTRYAPSPWIDLNRRVHEARSALVKVLETARADRDVWINLVHECPALANVALGAPVEIVSKKEAASLDWRMRALDHDLQHTLGPTWNKNHPPTNRDFALQIILSGWISDRWQGAMTVSKAIEVVVDAVRTYRHEHPK